MMTRLPRPRSSRTRVSGTLCEWQPFTDFLAATVGKPVLYQMDGPLGRVNLQASRDGEALNWHFDRSEFTTRVLLQAPQTGWGELEYRRDLRSADDRILTTSQPFCAARIHWSPTGP